MAFTNDITLGMLDGVCPLGHLSTKHLSNGPGIPDLKLVEATVAIRAKLYRRLASRIATGRYRVTPIARTAYDGW